MQVTDLQLGGVPRGSEELANPTDLIQNLLVVPFLPEICHFSRGDALLIYIDWVTNNAPASLETAHDTLNVGPKYTLET